MRPPPSRYRVVERGRRLEVIDTLTGEPVIAIMRPRFRLPATRGGAKSTRPARFVGPSSQAEAERARDSAGTCDSGIFVTQALVRRQGAAPRSA